MLKTTLYVWKCVLGVELMYVACLLYGLTMPSEKIKLHQDLLSQFPFFVWGDPVRMALTGLSLAVYAAVIGWYIVWMHNSSME